MVWEMMSSMEAMGMTQSKGVKVTTPLHHDVVHGGNVLFALVTQLLLQLHKRNFPELN